MTQFSLPSLDTFRQLSSRSSSAGDAASFLSSLRPGQIVQAQVVEALGNSLFTLKFADLNITTESATPLPEGSRLTLQVQANGEGKPKLSVLTISERRIAEASTRPSRPEARPTAATVPNQPGAPNPAATGENAANTRAQVLAEIIPVPSSAAGGVGGAGLGVATAANETGLANVETAAANAGSAATPGTTSPLSQAGPAVLRQFQSLLETGDLLPQNQVAIPPKLASLLKPDGPVARLVQSRPDLAPRLQNLLMEIQQRPAGLGGGLDQLTTQLNRLIQSATPDQQASLGTLQSRLFSQILGSANLEQPEQLAQNLASRMQQWVRGFEGTVARGLPEILPEAQVAPPAELAPGTTVPSNTEAKNNPLQQIRPSTVASPEIVQNGGNPAAKGGASLLGPGAAAAEGSISTASAERSTASTNAGQVVRGTFESDLKGQLLELRSQLEQVGERQGAPSANTQQAIARVDALLNQVTAQQVRNVEGLNQFLYAEIPVDPKSGIGEARLQVFYRNQGNVRKPDQNDRFTVALFLNLTKLGDVLAVVTEVDKAVTVGFTVEDPVARNLLGNQADLLRTALVKSGHAGATVTVRAPAKPEGNVSAGNAAEEEIWQSFLDSGPVTGNPGGRLNLEA